MPGFGASHLGLPLEIGEGDIGVTHGHGPIDMTEQLRPKFDSAFIGADSSKKTQGYGFGVSSPMPLANAVD
jgi:hypothetical protein